MISALKTTLVYTKLLCTSLDRLDEGDGAPIDVSYLVRCVFVLLSIVGCRYAAVEYFHPPQSTGALLKLKPLRLPHDYSVASVLFSANGLHIITGDDNGSIQSWSASDGKKERGLFEVDAVACMSLAPRSGNIFVGFKHGGVCRWDDGFRTRVSGSARPLQALAVSDIGKIFATGGEDSIVRIWDSVATQPRLSLEGHRGAVRGLAFDGVYLASAGDDGVIRLWDWLTGEPMRTMNHEGAVRAVAFSPDGRILASAGSDQSIRFWNPTTGTELIALREHVGRVTCLAFSPDGALLVSGNEEGEVIVWDTAIGQEHYRLQGHSARVRSLAFSPLGYRLASAGHDGEVLVWELSLTGRLSTITPEQLEFVWADMASDNPVRSYTIFAMAAGREQALAFLKSRLRGELKKSVTRDRLKQLIQNLDDDDPAVREEATRTLARLGRDVESELRIAAQSCRSPEASERLSRIQQHIARLPINEGDHRRRMRCVQVLERIKSEEALSLLELLSTEAPWPEVRKAASDALVRSR